jgi:hypothetical protein
VRRNTLAEMERAMTLAIKALFFDVFGSNQVIAHPTYGPLTKQSRMPQPSLEGPDPMRDRPG